jgi:hypothetical protein
MTYANSCSATPTANLMDEFLNADLDFSGFFQDDDGFREGTSDPSTRHIDNDDFQNAQYTTSLLTFGPKPDGMLRGLNMGSSLIADTFSGSGKPDTHYSGLDVSVPLL